MLNWVRGRKFHALFSLIIASHPIDYCLFAFSLSISIYLAIEQKDRKENILLL
jgi:hypothetical protein